MPVKVVCRTQGYKGNWAHGYKEEQTVVRHSCGWLPQLKGLAEEKINISLLRR